MGSFHLCAVVWSLGPGYNRWPEIIYENYHHCAGITWPMYIYYLIWSFLPYACSYVSLYTIWQYFHPSCVCCKHVDASFWNNQCSVHLKPNCHKMKTILWYHLCSESLRCLTTTESSRSSTSAGWEFVFPGRQWSTGKMTWKISVLSSLNAFLHQCWTNEFNLKGIFGGWSNMVCTSCYSHTSIEQ